MPQKTKKGGSQKRETDCKELQLFDGLEGRCTVSCFFLFLFVLGAKKRISERFIPFAGGGIEMERFGFAGVG